MQLSLSLARKTTCACARSAVLARRSSLYARTMNSPPGSICSSRVRNSCPGSPTSADRTAQSRASSRKMRVISMWERSSTPVVREASSGVCSVSSAFIMSGINMQLHILGVNPLKYQVGPPMNLGKAEVLRTNVGHRRRGQKDAEPPPSKEYIVSA